MDKPPEKCYIRYMKIKKITLLILMIFGAAILMPACGYKLPQSRVPSDAPAEIKRAVRKESRNVLIGIGKATGTATSQLTETLAVARARTAISRQLNSMVRDMITAYRAESSLDPAAALAFEDNITVVLSGSTLTGSAVRSVVKDDKGTLWAMVILPKRNALMEIERAQNQARTRVPAASNVDITVNIENAFNTAVSAGPQVH